MSIYNYSSAIQFIKDEIIRQKSETHFFSQRYLAKRLEVPASTLNAILKGNRKMPEKLKNKIADFLSFSDLEKNYFEILTKIDNLDDKELKSILINFKYLLIPATEKDITQASEQNSTVPATINKSLTNSTVLIENDSLFIRKDQIRFTKSCFYELRSNLDLLIGKLKELDKKQDDSDSNKYNVYIQISPLQDT